MKKYIIAIVIGLGIVGVANADVIKTAIWSITPDVMSNEIKIYKIGVRGGTCYESVSNYNSSISCITVPEN